MISFEVNGTEVDVDDDGASLLEVLRDRLGLRAAKDGCSPQGQCGCCTVLVDGEPRVACVTMTRRMAGRKITTLEGFDPSVVAEWSDAFCSEGASQCGFCSPGIVVRLEGLRRRGTLGDPVAVEKGLAAHLCRCTGWQPIVDAAARVASSTQAKVDDVELGSRRATIEGATHQMVGPEVTAGRGGFADDGAPLDALIAVRDGSGEWVVGETLTEARRAAGRVQGRRTTVPPRPPLDLPAGPWDVVLRTGWVEPAYLEVDVAWCEPGGEPSTVLANGGAFGGKVASPLPAAARELADRHGRTVVARWTREDVVRLGPKRPPIAAGMRSDGTGVLRVVRTAGIAAAVGAVAPGLEVEEVDVLGPPTSAAVRGAGWVEAAVLAAALRGDTLVTSPDGARAETVIRDGALDIEVSCGDVLDEIVLRSYCVGAAHMAIGWVTSEGLAVDEQGEVLDLTIRSFGILRASDMPTVRVTVVPGGGPAVAGSDAVFASVAAAVWQRQGRPTDWPTGVGFAP